MYFIMLSANIFPSNSRFQLNVLVDKPHRMIRFYGTTLANESVPIRDLGAKTFTILFRKLKPGVFKTHLRRTVSALVSRWDRGSLQNNTTDIGDIITFDVCQYPLSPIESKQEELHYQPYFSPISGALDGISKLVFYSMKGVRGCLHSAGGEKLSTLLQFLLPISKQASAGDDGNSDARGDAGLELKYILGSIVTESVRRLFRHLLPANTSEVWIRLAVFADALSQAWSSPASSTRPLLELGTAHAVELYIFALAHSHHRALSDAHVRSAVGATVVTRLSGFIEHYIDNCRPSQQGTSHLTDRVVVLFSVLWHTFQQTEYVSRLSAQKTFLAKVLAVNSVIPASSILSVELLPHLSETSSQRALLVQLLLADVSKSPLNDATWFPLLVSLLFTLYDVRNKNNVKLPAHIISLYENCQDELNTIGRRIAQSLLGMLSSPPAGLVGDASGSGPITLAAVTAYKWFQIVDGSYRVASAPTVQLPAPALFTLYPAESFAKIVVNAAAAVDIALISPFVECYSLNLTRTTKGAVPELAKKLVESLYHHCLLSSLRPSLGAVWALVHLSDALGQFSSTSDSKSKKKLAATSPVPPTHSLYVSLLTAEQLSQGLAVIGGRLSTASYWLRIG